MNIYKAGYNHAGSYLVSGKPWLKNSTIADGDIEFYHFPNITKEIVVRNDHLGAGHDLSVAFPEPRRAVNMPNGNEYFSGTFSALGTLSVGFWFKFDGSLPSAIRLVDIRDASGNSKVRVQTNSSNRIRLRVNDTNNTTSGAVLVANTWHHIGITINRSAPLVQIYLDGAALINNSANAVNADVAQIKLGDTGTNFDGLYCDATLFSAALSAAESLALFSGAGNIDPRDHAQAANLVSWWAFEDNRYKNYFTTPDTGTTIQDRVGSNNLTIDSGAATFGLGRHYASIFNENKSYLLNGAEEITTECRTTFMAVKCSGGSLNYSIQASLTGIDPRRDQGTGLYD